MLVTISYHDHDSCDRRFMNPEQDYAVIIEADEEKQHGDVCSAIETSKHSQSARWHISYRNEQALEVCQVAY